MGAKRPSEPTPWCLFGFFLGIQKEARRPQGGEIPLQKPLGTARRVVAPYRRRSLPGGRPHGAAPTKNPNQGGFTEKKNPGAAGASPRPTGFFLRRPPLKMPPHPALRATFPIPSVASRHLPLIRGVGPQGEGLKRAGIKIPMHKKENSPAAQRQPGC